MGKLISTKELSDRIGVKEGTIRVWVYKQEIPFVRVRSLVRFDPDAVERWIASQNRPPSTNESQAPG